MKHRLTILSTVTLLLLMAFSYMGYRHYFVARTPYTPYAIAPKPSDTLRIAYIGDSWAFFHRPYDKSTSELLTEKLRHPAIFRSYGICGFTSHEIYEQLFCNDSLQQLLSSGIDICIISAGINDTYKKMPTRYYAQSMDGLLSFLLYNHIYPIIQEIPDYDIKKSYHRQTLSRKALRQLSMTIHRLQIDCKQLYRETLDTLLKTQGYEPQVGVLRYQDWNSHYLADLQQYYQSDGLHLNASGYAKLDSCIAEQVLKSPVLRKKADNSVESF